MHGCAFPALAHAEHGVRSPAAMPLVNPKCVNCHAVNGVTAAPVSVLVILPALLAKSRSALKLPTTTGLPPLLAPMRSRK